MWKGITGLYPAALVALVASCAIAYLQNTPLQHLANEAIQRLPELFRPATEGRRQEKG
jgi:hypothetical protein